MAKKPSKTTLTLIEKSVIKALLNDGWRNQDIQTLINTGRTATINFGRISTIKGDQMIAPATKQQVEAFRRKKVLFDHVTGLCPFDDERFARVSKTDVEVVPKTRLIRPVPLSPTAHQQEHLANREQSGYI
jgi:hypothetical protein